MIIVKESSTGIIVYDDPVANITFVFELKYNLISFVIQRYTVINFALPLMQIVKNVTEVNGCSEELLNVFVLEDICMSFCLG